MEAAPQTQDLTAARLRYAGDWDNKPVTSISLPVEIAEQLLRDRGWTLVAHRPRSHRDAAGRLRDRNEVTHSYNAPDGVRYWELDEALRLALTAEVTA